MKIVMVAPALGEAFGQERVIQDSSFLLRKSGHVVHLLGEKRLGDLPPCDGVKFIESMGSLHSFSPRKQVEQTCQTVLRHLDTLGPDVVHLIDQFDYRLLRLLGRNYPTILTSHTMATTCPSSTRLVRGMEGCPERSGWKCVLHHHRYQCLPQYKSDIHRIQSVHNYLLRRKALLALGKVIAISRYVEETLLKDGWPRDRIKLVYNPVEVPSEIPKKRLFLDKPLILCASRLEPHKGIVVLLKGLALIKGENWETWICGDGPQKEEVIKLSSRLGIAHKVHFKGRLPYSSLREIMGTARVVVQTNMGPEPFGLSVAEASALGKPVIASRLPAIPEIIEDGKSGYLIPPGDPKALAEALMRILTDDLLVIRMGETGRKIISSRFSPQLHLEETLRVYSECSGVFGQSLLHPSSSMV